MKDKKPLKRKGHHNREDLVGEHPAGDLGQLIFLFLFLAAWITDSFVVHYSTILSKTIPLFVRIPAAVILFLTGWYLVKTGLKIVFGKVRKEPVVIRESVFNVVRHPVYLGAIIFYTALIILTVSIISGIIFIFIAIFYHFIARKEEELLLEKFGKAYEAYIKEVPMWFPRIIKK
jgi:protein-S-isoprenylcysteine O-methyltransferase Ste14